MSSFKYASVILALNLARGSWAARLRTPIFEIGRTESHRPAETRDTVPAFRKVALLCVNPELDYHETSVLWQQIEALTAGATVAVVDPCLELPKNQDCKMRLWCAKDNMTQLMTVQSSDLMTSRFLQPVPVLQHALGGRNSYVVPWSVDCDFVDEMEKKWGSMIGAFDLVVDVACPDIRELNWDKVMNNIYRLLRPDGVYVQFYADRLHGNDERASRFMTVPTNSPFYQMASQLATKKNFSIIQASFLSPRPLETEHEVTEKNFSSIQASSLSPRPFLTEHEAAESERTTRKVAEQHEQPMTKVAMLCVNPEFDYPETMDLAPQIAALVEEAAVTFVDPSFVLPGSTAKKGFLWWDAETNKSQLEEVQQIDQLMSREVTSPSGEIEAALEGRESRIVPWSVDADFVAAMDVKWGFPIDSLESGSFDYVVDVSCPMIGLNWPLFFDNIAKLLKPDGFLVQMWGQYRSHANGGSELLEKFQEVKKSTTKPPLARKVADAKWWIKRIEDEGEDLQYPLNKLHADWANGIVETKAL